MKRYSQFTRFISFKRAICREPGRSIIKGITSQSCPQPIFELAVRQHKDYVQALQTCGVEVTVLPALEEYPDSCFCEDPALCLPSVAILTRPGADTRRGEVQHISAAIKSAYECVEEISHPGTLEGGDVLVVGPRVYVGLSARTNAAGVEQLAAVARRHGLSVEGVRLGQLLHLKTGVSALADGTLLLAGELVDHPAFRDVPPTRRILVPPEEMYAANCVAVNGRVVMPAGFPRTRQLVEERGWPVVPVDMSEFAKVDGGVSCLSLRF